MEIDIRHIEKCNQSTEQGQKIEVDSKNIQLTLQADARTVP